MIKKTYDFAVIATDIVILTIRNEKLQVLLIKMTKKPYEDCWAVPGGLVKPDESVDQAAKYHLGRKTGITSVYLEQLYTFGEVSRDPFGRVVSVAYFALVPSDDFNLKTTERYADITWFPVDKLPKLAYDHRQIIKRGVQRLQSKLEYTNVVYGLLPKDFTLNDLQRAYEIILDKKLDKRNFRKKILSLGLIKATGKKTLGSAHRPAALYKFISTVPQNIQIL